LFQDDSQDALIKITYAGVANVPSQSNSKNSNRFVIPEWNPSGKDIYSVGMIAYKLLSGGKEPPTDMDTQRVVPGTNLFFGRRWKLISISKNAKNFIERCLHSWDMKPQFTVEDALQHIWMTQEHVHRSDTSRPAETNDVVAGVNWNGVGSSLTASEPAVFHSTAEFIPVVSLTAEQYTRDVLAKTPNKEDSSDDHDENNIPVFVNDAADAIADTVESDEAIATDETAACEIIDDTTENVTQELVPELTSPERIDEDQVNDDINKTLDVSNTKTIDLQQPEVDAIDAASTIDAVTEHNAESITHEEYDVSAALDISETQTPDEFVDLRDVFHEVTTGSTENGSTNVVTMEAFKERLRARYTEEEVNSWFTGHEKYEDPKNLDYKVFLRKVIQNRKSIEIQRVDTAFKLIDKGKHGFVTVGNLRAVLGKDNNENIEQLIKAADTNRDGKISYENFERVVQNYLSSQT
jgi:Ca2+-binding EF-hand superfamily protein